MTYSIQILRAVEIAQELISDQLPILASRHDGKVFLSRLRPQLLQSPMGVAIDISFRNVRLMDGSFADEVFGTLAAERARREFEGTAFYVSSLNDSSLDNLRFALISRAKLDEGLRHCILPVQNAEGDLRLIGKTEEQVQQTFDLLRMHKELTTAQISHIMSLSPAAASTRLKVLSDLGLALRREVRDEQGKQYIYRWIS